MGDSEAIEITRGLFLKFNKGSKEREKGKTNIKAHLHCTCSVFVPFDNVTWCVHVFLYLLIMPFGVYM